MSPQDPSVFEKPSRLLVELDKETGLLLTEQGIPDLHTGVGWAFAAWGGNYCFFSTQESTGKPERLARAALPPSTAALVTVVEDTIFTVVGAGVSTCAPLIPE